VILPADGDTADVNIVEMNGHALAPLSVPISAAIVDGAQLPPARGFEPRTHHGDSIAMRAD
jgi:hypothetical protein